MDLSELGEFDIIARLTRGLESRPDVLLAVGDDAALLEPAPNSLLVATCDSQVEGIHFLRDVATPRNIGHKSLAVNLSDIAAMGAEPLWALVSLLLPRSLDGATLDGVYAGLRELAQRYSIALVGGNVTATSGPFTIDVTLLGRVAYGAAVTRSGGKPGDAILITGSLGGAAAGVLVATQRARNSEQAKLAPEMLQMATTKMAAPTPRVVEGQALAATRAVTAMADVSDGLLADLGHICVASHTGALIDARAVPLDEATVEIAEAYRRDPLELALSGGEDYELVCTVQPEHVADALAAVARVGGVAHVIGQLTDEREGLRLKHGDGTVDSLELRKQRGWDHFR